ncbi:MAG: hypothetical protein WBL54_10010 [Nitrososphaeraceae archaeon]
MKTRSLNPFVIITLLAITILTVNGYQMKVAFSQDEETPDFGGTKAPFTPLPEDDRSPPPPPSNATKVNELPKSLFVEENDTDSEPLVIANKTELLEVLPANATNAIEFIDSSLKNSTGQGLLPAGVLNNVTGAGNLNMSSGPTGEKRNITTILDFLNKENLTKEILPLISPANKSVTSEDLEEMDEPQPSNITENATTSEEQPTSENATTSEEQSGKDEAVPPINQESEQQPPVAEDQGNTKNKEPLNNTELALSNNTEQELLNNTDLGPSKDGKQ